MRYAEVRCGPPPVARVLPVQWATCIVEHVLKVRDEAEAIQEAVFIHCPRMPLSKIAPRVGEVPEEYSLWLRLWIQIDLKGVHHFPSWEQEVEEIMHEHFVQLHEIFSHYCKANWTPEDAEEAATLWWETLSLEEKEKKEEEEAMKMWGTNGSRPEDRP